jgi:hypothetical protein
MWLCLSIVVVEIDALLLVVLCTVFTSKRNATGIANCCDDRA